MASSIEQLPTNLKKVISKQSKSRNILFQKTIPAFSKFLDRISQVRAEADALAMNRVPNSILVVRGAIRQAFVQGQALRDLQVIFRARRCLSAVVVAAENFVFRRGALDADGDVVVVESGAVEWKDSVGRKRHSV